MPLGTRILKATLSMQSGDVVLDESLDLRVRIHKDALAVQNMCSIDVFNLSQNLREALLSQFTAWNKRQVETGATGALSNYVNVNVQAGYRNANQDTSTTVFAGQVVTATPVSSPPNIGVRIECYSQQLNRTAWITEPAPTTATFKAYVQWAAKQMGVSSVQCETSYDNVQINNPSASTHVAGNLLIDIQNAYRPNVAAFIDNNILYVKDINKILSTAQITTVSEFIGTPMWTEWGVEFQTLFDPKITLAGAVTLQSKMNPSLNQSFVMSSIDYDLTSRERAFYLRGYANPPA